MRAEVAALLGDVDGSWQLLTTRPPFETSADAEIVELVSRHAGGPEVVGAPFWADSALLHQAGIPTVLFGPSWRGRSTRVVEWVEIASLERCLEIYVAVAAELVR